MESLAYILGISGALLIAYQDIKDREIHLLAFLLFLGGAISMYFFNPLPDYWKSSLINLGFVFFMLLAVYLIFRLRGKQLRINKELGLGDILMLGILCFWFNAEQFIFFYALSLSLFSLLALLFIRLRKADKDYPIPLAGGLAIFFLLFFPFRNILWSI